MDQATRRAAWLISYGATREEVRAEVLPLVIDEGEFFLIYQAAWMMVVPDLTAQVRLTDEIVAELIAEERRDAD